MTKRVKIVESVDRISSLPDSILCHILSFLPTNVGVSTCILLTRSRWRDLFPFSNNLDFVQSLGNDPNGTSLFMDFVDRFIKLMNGKSLDKFRLKCSNAVHTSRIHSWIAPLLCNVRELDLCIGWRQPGKEYSCVFITYNTLVVLKLGTGFSLNVPASVCFPCLKTLQLQLIRLPHKDSLIQRLVPSCPVLEDLLIVGCNMKDVPVLSLSSPSLKRLTIDKHYHYDPYTLVLDTPSLVHLEFVVCTSEGHILKNLGSLCEARIDIPYRFEGPIDHHQLLAGLGNVQSLYLSGKVENFLPETLDVSEKLPLLENVTRLVLESSMRMSSVIKLLQYFPNLEEFETIQGGCDVPSRLKSIECELVFVGGTRQHQELVPLEYILKNFNMLEKLQIRIRMDCLATRREVIEKLETKMVTMIKLGKAPSRSKTCEINVFFNGERVIFSK